MRKGDFTIGGIHYLDLVEASRARQITITREATKRLERMYEDVATELLEKANKAGRGSLTERWALDYKKSIETTLKAMREDQYDIISGSIKKAAENGIYIQLSVFDELNKEYSLGMDETFRKVLSGVPQQALNELLSGGIYKDGRGLSKRIWRDSKEFEKDIGYIIETGLGAKKSAVNLAKDLESYVKGSSRTNFNWGNCYPNLRSKKCSYEAQRLARTSISHAYQLATVRGCKDNPYITGIQWLNSNAHDRTCELCRERAEADYYGLGVGIYPDGLVPLDHPNGMCTLSPYIPKSMDEIAQEMKDWVNGGENPKLDKWFEGLKEVDKTAGSDKIKEQGFVPAKTVKEAEEYARTMLGISNVSYKGVDVETANAWNEGLKDSFGRFPELKKYFGFTGECHERNAMMKPTVFQYYMTDLRKRNPGWDDISLEPHAKKQTEKFMRKFAISKYTLAESYSPSSDIFKVFGGVTVNRDHGNNAEKFIQRLKANVNSKFHPVGCDTIRSVLDHEIGHQLDQMLDISKQDNIKTLYNSMTNSEITDNLSTYSWENSNVNKYGEFIAEGWAEYLNNMNPRPVAKEIGETIERVYELWKKKN